MKVWQCKKFMFKCVFFFLSWICNLVLGVLQPYFEDKIYNCVYKWAKSDKNFIWVNANVSPAQGLNGILIQEVMISGNWRNLNRELTVWEKRGQKGIEKELNINIDPINMLKCIYMWKGGCWQQVECVPALYHTHTLTYAQTSPPPVLKR